MGEIIAGAVAGAAAFVLLLILFLICPGNPSAEKKARFAGRAYAHRGLYKNGGDSPENSLPAFKRAVDAGYGIELDVQLSSDGEVVVFHDDDLKRACGVEKRVDGLTLAELQKLSLFESGERIPLFSQVLELVGGKVPLIVELKTGKRNAELCEKTLALLRAYGGDACVESFDPRIVRWFRKNARDILRGQLSQAPAFYRGYGFNPFLACVLGNLYINCLSRPEFIAYRLDKKPLTVRAAEYLGALRFGWTAPGDSLRGLDGIIFEPDDDTRGENGE